MSVNARQSERGLVSNLGRQHHVALAPRMDHITVPVYKLFGSNFH